MAPFKQVYVKNNTCDWVDEDILNGTKSISYKIFTGTHFISTKAIQNRRNSENRFKIPLKKTNIGQHGLSYTGPMLSNNLPRGINLSKNRNLFKYKMKSAYFEKS